MRAFTGDTRPVPEKFEEALAWACLFATYMMSGEGRVSVKPRTVGEHVISELPAALERLESEGLIA